MFKLDNNIKTEFKALKKVEFITVDFDIFFYCSLIGMVYNRYGDSRNSNDLVKTVPLKYIEDGKFNELVLTLLNLEIRNSGYNINNRKDVEKICKSILDTNSITNLTDVGIKALNSYCVGGFEIIKENEVNVVDPMLFIEDYRRLITIKQSQVLLEDLNHLC